MSYIEDFNEVCEDVHMIIDNAEARGDSRVQCLVSNIHPIFSEWLHRYLDQRGHPSEVSKYLDYLKVTTNFA